MSSWYLDTSAALKLVLHEPESEALIEAINTHRPTLAAGFLLETELRRAVHRSPQLSQRQITSLLDRVELHEVTPSVFRQAGLLPGDHLGSLDALHLAAAMMIGAERILTYDRRMLAAAVEIGLDAIAPC